MRLAADENVPRTVVSWLRASGHDVLEVPPGTGDRDFAAMAQAERRVLLTQDKDFANILEYPPAAHLGIVVLRVHPPTIEKIQAALAGFFARFGSDEDARGRLFVLDNDGIRARV